MSSEDDSRKIPSVWPANGKLRSAGGPCPLNYLFADVSGAMSPTRPKYETATTQTNDLAVRAVEGTDSGPAVARHPGEFTIVFNEALE